jgi:hypothetical protein
VSETTDASQGLDEPPKQSEGSHLDTSVLLALYAAATSQNQQYADFRFKILGFLTTLQAALLYGAVQASVVLDRIILAIVGLTIAAILWAMEERHHAIFDQSRKAAFDIEDRLMASDFGVFSRQIKEKNGLGHRAITEFSSILVALGWCAVIIVNVFF